MEEKKYSKCGRKMEIWTRIVGYYRPTNNFNDGKKEEYKIRKTFKISLESKDDKKSTFEIS